MNFEAIKSATDIVRVVESYGIALRRVGKDHVGLCPFHDDTNPSLHVTQAKGLFHCPACGAGGNAIQFVARKENLTNREAALKLCASMPGVMRGSQLPMARKEKSSFLAVDEATQARLLARVVAFYAKTLNKDRAGLEYLAGRNLDDGAMLETFSVGYCNGTMRSALPRSGEVIEQLKAIGILNEGGNEIFFGRIVVPIFDAVGNVVSLYGRLVESGACSKESVAQHGGEAAKKKLQSTAYGLKTSRNSGPPHLYLRGERRGVFNGMAAKAHQSLIVTEAIFDAMSLWAAGYRNAIALYGKDGWTADHETLIGENGITEILLALDNDERGQEAADKLTTYFQGQAENRTLNTEHSMRVHRIVWPEGVKDANNFFLSRDAAAFQALLDAANLPNPHSEIRTPQSSQSPEAIEMREGGFVAEYDGRRYELCAIERPSAAKLRATVKALNSRVQPGQASRLFHIDTVDFYLSRSRRVFVSEAARLFRESSEVIEGDVNRLITQLENYVEQRLEEKSVVLLAEADQHEAQRLGKSHDLVAEIQSDLDKLGLIGERTNRLLLYLAMTSRKMDDPLAVQILSGSGAGKSHLQDAVLSLCPEEDLIKLTSLSGQALFYKGEDSLRHKCLAIAEVAGAEGARYAMRNLISEKKLVIESTIKNAMSGRLETQLNTVHGPTAVFETTTQPDTDPETKSRYVLLSVDESAEQTRAILEMQRRSHTLDGRKRWKARKMVRTKHHAFQRLLEAVAVINPFEPLLSYGDDRLTFRRDHPKYLNLILAVTFLHQMQRPRKHDADLGDYIETTLDDIAIANDLAAELFAQSLDDLSSPSRELLRLIGQYVRRRGVEQNKSLQAVEFTRRELREAIKWTESRLRLHLGELMKLEYIGAISGRFGQCYSHRLLVDPQEIESGVCFVPGIKSVEQLGKEAQCLSGSNLAPKPRKQNDNLASRNGHLATTSQGKSCEVQTPAKTHQYRLNGHIAPNLASKNGTHIRSFA